MLRCSHCGAEFSEWAARCPSCREPANPVETPRPGAPATEGGGDTGASGNRRHGPPARKLPGPVVSYSPEILVPPAAGNGHAVPVRPVAPVTELRAVPSRPEPSFQTRPQPLGATAPDGNSGGNSGNKGGSKRGRRVPPALVIIGLTVAGLVVTLLVSRNRTTPPSSPQVLGTQTQRPSPTAAPADEVSALLGFTLVVADTGADVAIAPFSGTRQAVAGFAAPGYPEVPVRTGGSVVVVRAGIAYALRPPFTAAPVPIGPADHVFPALTAGGVGIWRAQAPVVPGGGTPTGALPTVQFVAVPGTGATAGSDAVTIPRGLRPLAELPQGILVWNEQTPRGSLRVWRPSASSGPGTFVRTLGVASAVVGWSGDRVAWLAAAGCTSNGECPLHITDAATGSDALVAPPPGFAGYLPAGAFSPTSPTSPMSPMSPTSNPVLGVFVFNPVQQAPAARLVLVSLATATPGARPRWTPALVPQADVDWERNGQPLSVVWTPDGSHVLFSGSSGKIHDHVPGGTTSSATEQPASASFTVVGASELRSPSPVPSTTRR